MSTFRTRRQKALLAYVSAALGQPPAPDPQISEEQEILRLTEMARDQGLIRDHVATTSTNPDEAKHGGNQPVAPALEVDRLVQLARSENLSGRYGPLFGTTP